MSNIDQHFITKPAGGRGTLTMYTSNPLDLNFNTKHITYDNILYAVKKYSISQFETVIINKFAH